MATENKPQTAEHKRKNALIEVQEKNITDQVLNKVARYQEQGAINIPQNYSVANALKGAWLVLSGATDSKGKNLLSVCTETSVAQTLLDMVVQGLSVQKKQCYFIPYGDKLVCQRSYFGTVAIAKRIGAITALPVANVVYEGDDFHFNIDIHTGRKQILKHEQTLESIEKGIIKAVYCICQTPSGTDITIMTKAEIKKAWDQSPTKGNSPAHINFPAEMSKRTVIGRACKLAINSSDDAYLYADYRDEDDFDVTEEKRNDLTVNAGTKSFVENADYEDITNAPSSAPESTTQPAQSEAPASEVNEDMPY